MKRLMWIMLCGALLAGCSRGLEFKIRFDAVDGLEKESRVIFDKNPMGSVTGVSYADAGHFLVSVRIEKDFESAVTGHSRFFIVSDSGRPGKKAVEMIRVRPGGTPIEPGSVIQGTTRTSALMEQITEKLKTHMDDLGKTLKEFSGELEKEPEGNQDRESRSQWDRLVDEIQNFIHLVRDKVENEMLPRINEFIDMLRNFMKDETPEKDTGPRKTGQRI